MAATPRTVTVQVPPLVGHVVFAEDRALCEAVGRHVAPGVLPVALEALGELGRAAGSGRVSAHPSPVVLVGADAEGWGLGVRELPRSPDLASVVARARPGGA